MPRVFWQKSLTLGHKAYHQTGGQTRVYVHDDAKVQQTILELYHSSPV